MESKFRANPEKMSRQLTLKDSIIADQRKEIYQLKDENAKLRRLIKHSLSFLKIEVPPEISLSVPEEAESPWAKKSERFELVKRMVLEVVYNLCKRTGRSIPYKEIYEAFKVRYPGAYKGLGNDPDGTIGRRVRELVQDRWLISPSSGEFSPGPLAAQQLIPKEAPTQ